MSTVNSIFKRKPGLVVYVTCGDPDLNTTKDILLAACEAGADLIELGVPFSDPVADGSVIQRASERALRNGTSLRDVLRIAHEIHNRQPRVPLLIFSYLNPVLHMGMRDFCAAAAGAGVSCALLTDLTLEEAGDFRRCADTHGLAPIFLAAPTSTDERLRRIAQSSISFIYAVSRTGVTGTHQQPSADARDLVGRLRRVTQLPIAVGFGISTPQQFAEIGEFSDAAVVGSAIVKTIEESPARAAQAVGQLIQSFRAAVPAKSAMGI
jgi:tryptophan synthase alpha chain